MVSVLACVFVKQIYDCLADMSDVETWLLDARLRVGMDVVQCGSLERVSKDLTS